MASALLLLKLCLIPAESLIINALGLHIHNIKRSCMDYVLSGLEYLEVPDCKEFRNVDVQRK